MCNKIFSFEPEKLYSETQKQSYLKKHSQYFTPYNIAHFMASWVVNSRKSIDILDPALGLGIFLRACYELEAMLNFTGYETDPLIFSEARELFISAGINAHFRLDNYLLKGWNGLYDGIICNPPYMSFRRFIEKDKALKEIQSRVGIKLSGFSNIYVLFIIKSLYQLKEKGRAAYIVPAEFLNANYGIKVKEYLIKSGMLKYIIVFTDNTRIFKNALTTSAILLFSKDFSKHSIELLTLEHSRNLTQLGRRLTEQLNKRRQEEAVSHAKNRYKPESIGMNITELNPGNKWGVYFRQKSLVKYKNLVPFSHYARAVRGIATGSNSYFLFNREKQEKSGIPDRFFMPCISKARQVPGSFFTEEQYKTLLERGESVLLFNGKNGKERHAAEYIEAGEEREVNRGYLTSRRNPWYRIEKREPSPIWVGTFHRKKLRFVRNEAEVYNLTAFHCIYLNTYAKEKINLFFAYLLTDTAAKIFDSNVREYDRGLKKLEPNDLNDSKVVDLLKIDEKLERTIEDIYDNYRESVLSGYPKGTLLGDLNDIFLKILKT